MTVQELEQLLFRLSPADQLYIIQRLAQRLNSLWWSTCDLATCLSCFAKLPCPIVVFTNCTYAFPRFPLCSPPHP